MSLIRTLSRVGSDLLNDVQVAALQVLYALAFGAYPLNSFLAGLFSSLGMFTLTGEYMDAVLTNDFSAMMITNFARQSDYCDVLLRYPLSEPLAVQLLFIRIL